MIGVKMQDVKQSLCVLLLGSYAGQKEEHMNPDFSPDFYLS